MSVLSTKIAYVRAWVLFCVLKYLCIYVHECCDVTYNSRVRTGMAIVWCLLTITAYERAWVLWGVLQQLCMCKRWDLGKREQKTTPIRVNKVRRRPCSNEMPYHVLSSSPPPASINSLICHPILVLLPCRWHSNLAGSDSPFVVAYLCWLLPSSGLIPGTLIPINNISPC